MTKVKYKNEELIKLARDGDKNAEEELFLVNESFCFHIARKFENTGIDKEDLASIAKIGLLKAYNTFDLDKGFKFITYASRLMNNEILMYLRKNNKHKHILSLDSTISTDKNGNDLDLIDVVSAPEKEIKFEDYEELNWVLKIFYENAKERDIEVLNRCILNGEVQREVAKDLNVSQSYVARIIIAIEKELRTIVETGKYKRLGRGNQYKFKVERKKEDKMAANKYNKHDYFYIFKNYPNLTDAELAEVLNKSTQGIYPYRKKFKEGKYDLAEYKIAKQLAEKLDKYVLEHKTEMVKKPEVLKKRKTALEISDELAMPDIKVEEIVTLKNIDSPIIEDLKLGEAYMETIPNEPEVLPILGFKKEEISNEEIIILNNKISTTSNRDDISQLVYGVFQLLNNCPEGSKVKIDLNFEVSIDK